MTTAYIVTGTTRGIGRALARQIIADGDLLYTISSADNEITTVWHNINCDLGDPDSAVVAIERLLDSVRVEAVRSLVLINNAGVLGPIGPIDADTDWQIARQININVIAPAVLMAVFIRQTAGLEIERRIINISSGAARHPYAGWSVYCSAKAFLEMMTRCAAAEQALREDPVVVCAVCPGRVETRMQRRIRDSSPDQFPAQPDFIQAKNRGDVIEPQRIAEMLLTLDRAGQLRNGHVYDLRDVQQHAGGLSIDPIRI
jgi:benzil reductase ((S)-benzoin forming)